MKRTFIAAAGAAIAFAPISVFTGSLPVAHAEPVYPGPCAPNYINEGTGPSGGCKPGPGAVMGTATTCPALSVWSAGWCVSVGGPAVTPGSDNCAQYSAPNQVAAKKMCEDAVARGGQ
jgi:hypothetical protein